MAGAVTYLEPDGAEGRLLTPEERTGSAADGNKRAAKSRRTGKGGK